MFGRNCPERFFRDGRPPVVGVEFASVFVKIPILLDLYIVTFFFFFFDNFENTELAPPNGVQDVPRL